MLSTVRRVTAERHDSYDAGLSDGFKRGQDGDGSEERENRLLPTRVSPVSYPLNVCVA